MAKFPRRKWLPPPLRKLSQGKVDKSASSERPLVKKGSDKTFKLPTEKQTEEEYNSSNPSKSLINSQSGHQDVEADEEGTCDLPPPMKPIQDSQTMVANGPTALTVVEQSPCKRTSSLSLKTLEGNAPTDLEEIEQIVKEKMEQHESSKSKFLKPHDSENENGENDENLIENGVEMSLRKRMYALRELVTTEESYVQDLSLIVDGYIGEMKDPDSDIPLPDDLKGGKERMVFGNIEAIYEWHRDTFLKLLQRCMECPTELAPFIQKCKPKLRMYVIYCQNKPVSEHIVAEHLGYFEEVRLKLKHKLVLCDLLIKPVQRIMKYELLLRDYLKHTERAGLVNEIPNIQEAINVMKEVPKEANDMMDVGRLQNFAGKITAQGNLLQHGPLLCTEVDSNNRNPITVSKPKEYQVFLFDQNIILSEIIGKKTQFTNPAYFYKAHIQTNKMKIEELSDNRFLLRSTDPHREEQSFVLTTQTQEQYREWVDKINRILQKQNDFLAAIQSPIAFQKELTKESMKVLLFVVLIFAALCNISLGQDAEDAARCDEVAILKSRCRAAAPRFYYKSDTNEFVLNFRSLMSCSDIDSAIEEELLRPDPVESNKLANYRQTHFNLHTNRKNFVTRMKVLLFVVLIFAALCTISLGQDADLPQDPARCDEVPILQSLCRASKPRYYYKSDTNECLKFI
ncbi:Kalirin, partial [Pseudolycoriella hygida]